MKRRERAGPVKNNVRVISLRASGSRSDAACLLRFVEELERAGKIEPGATTDAWILHDEWCAVWHGGRTCDCNAALEIGVRLSLGPAGGEKYPENAGTGYATFQSHRISASRTVA